MSRKQYPIVGPWELTSKEKYFLVEKCDKCNHEFGPKEIWWIRHTQYSFMRGEDGADIRCNYCKRKP